eukprot:SAG31_NODE_1423_length_8400_cov_2.665944_9_plen_180_part_00
MQNVTFSAQATPTFCMHADGLNDGDGVTMITCSSWSTNEVWTYDDDDFTIRLSSRPSLCMNAYGNSLPELQDEIRMYTCSATINEQWTIHVDGSIRPRSISYLCMTQPDNPRNTVKLTRCTAASNQLFLAQDAVAEGGSCVYINADVTDATFRASPVNNVQTVSDEECSSQCSAQPRSE